ncbi:hypothetical protein RRG08_067300 [Elysia crispata]|uniref:Uncharacterized protein n=1 Tax=Elysia crispata TaxID=231223 RepID=A0AAE0Z9Y7_9GAST|nr:hypothetical protein RRG08_067300 [Elysia crispata]
MLFTLPEVPGRFSVKSTQPAARFVLLVISNLTSFLLRPPITTFQLQTRLNHLRNCLEGEEENDTSIALSTSAENTITRGRCT